MWAFKESAADRKNNSDEEAVLKEESAVEDYLLIGENGTTVTQKVPVAEEVVGQYSPGTGEGSVVPASRKNKKAEKKKKRRKTKVTEKEPIKAGRYYYSNRQAAKSLPTDGS